MDIILFTLPGGRLLSALRYGPATGKAIVFCHGMGSSGAALTPDESQLQASGTAVLIPQRPGVGASGVLKAYSVENVVADMECLLDHLGIRSVYVCGWAEGAAYAVCYATRFRAKVVGAGLINPALPFTGTLAHALPERWRRLIWFNRYLPALTRWNFEKMAGRVIRNAEQVLKKSLKNNPIADKVIFEQLHRRIALLDELREAWQHGGAAVFADCQALSRCAWDLRGISAPVDIWQGASDTVWTQETARHLKRRHTSAQFYLLANEGHLMYLDHWQEIARRANDLLR